jgi:hypothetical protein
MTGNSSSGLPCPCELFESQYESLRREFDNIRDRFAATA